MEEWTKKVVIVWWIILTAECSQMDPCLNNTILESRLRFDNVVDHFGSKVSDDDLKASWYKFDKCGLKMSEKCIKKGRRCGSEFPIWLKGTHPTGSETARAHVCSSLGTEDCCRWKEEILVKSCMVDGNKFYVYKLKSTERSMSYCVASLSACPSMEYYDEGATSCRPVANETFPLPVITKPQLEKMKTIVAAGREFTVTAYLLECVVDLSSTLYLRQQIDEIEIKFPEGELITCPSNVVCKHHMKEQFMLKKYDQQIPCMARYRLRSHPCSQDTHGYTPWFSSRPFKHDIRLQTKDGRTVDTVELYEGVINQYRLISNFPMTSLFCFYSTDLCQTTVKFKAFAEHSLFFGNCEVTFNKDGSFLSDLFYIEPKYEMPGRSWLNLSLEFDPSSPYVLPTDFKLSFQILTPHEKRSHCLLAFDHFITTLDGQTYEFDAAGDFELINNDFGFKVHIRRTHPPENKTTSYVCAVAVKDHDEILIVSLCGGFSVPRFARVFSSDEAVNRPEEKFSDFEIHHRSGFYEVVLDSGNVVVISTRKLAGYTSLNVHAIPMNGDKHRGLCQGKGSNVERLSEETSLFTMDLRKTDCLAKYLRDLYCWCSSSLHDKFMTMCALRNNSGFHSIKMCSSGNLCTSRRFPSDRGTYQYEHNGLEPKCERSDVLPKEEINPREIVVNPVETYHKLNESCLAIMNQSSAYEICMNVLEQSKLNLILAGCLDDFENNEAVHEDQIVAMFEELCLSELEIARKDKSGNVAKIESSMCPKACNGKGICNKGACICNPEFVGVDCSVPVNSVPEIEQILPDRCDESEAKMCSEIIVYAAGIIDGAGIKCRLQPLGVCGDFLGLVQIVNGVILSPGRILCYFSQLVFRRPQFLMAQISLSNNGTDFGVSMPYTIFNGACYHCTSASHCSPDKEFQQKQCLKGDTECLPSKDSAICIPKHC